MGRSNRFDTLTERRRSGSYKWDATGRVFGHDDLLPFWVADMDFATPDPVLDAVRERLAHTVFGYEERPAEYVDAVSAWLQRRHDWNVPREWLMFCPPSSIVAMYGLIGELTGPGDGIIVPTPTYGPLIDLVERGGRRLLACPLVAGERRFELDVDTMTTLADDARMILLCSPHNPTGRVFSEQELSAVAALATEHDLAVISDEVHADLVRPGHRHLPFGRFGVRRSATVISPNKTFNTAGLPQASVVIPDPELRHRFQQFLDTAQINHDSTFGGVAMIAAYRHCDTWLDELLAYLDANHRRVHDFVAAEVPGVRVWPAEATYLAWLDYRALGIGEAEALRLLAERGGVALYGGTQFGRDGRGFLRMNVACPRKTLDRGLEGIRCAFA